MDIDYLKSKNIMIIGNKLFLDKNVTVHIKGNKQYLVFPSGEIIELDKVYNITMSDVSGKGNVGIVLE